MAADGPPRPVMGHGVILVRGVLKPMFMTSSEGVMQIVEDITPDEAAAYAERAGPLISVGTPAEVVSATVGHTNALLAMATRLRHLEENGGGLKGVEFDAAKRRIVKLEAENATLEMAVRARDAEIEALRAAREGRLDIARICEAALQQPALRESPLGAISPIDISHQMDDAVAAPFRTAVTDAKEKIAQYEAVALLPAPGVEVSQSIETLRGELLLKSTDCLNVALHLLGDDGQQVDEPERLRTQLVVRAIHAAFNAVVDALSTHAVFGAE